MLDRVRPSPCSFLSTGTSCSASSEKMSICRRYFDRIANALCHNCFNKFDRQTEVDVEAAKSRFEPAKTAKYQQSSTRQLAFGGQKADDNRSAIFDSPKPLNDFYNNATLSLIAKVFSLVVIVVTVFMVLGMTDYSFFDWLL